MRFTIARRLTIGFGLTLALLAGVGGIALNTGWVGARSVQHMQELVQGVDAGGELDLAIRDMRLRANLYNLDPNEKRKQEVSDAARTAEEMIKLAKSELKEPSLHDRLTPIAGDIDVYARGSQELVGLIDRRTEIFYKRCGVVGLRTQETLHELASKLNQGAKHEQARKAYEALALVNQTRLGVARFLFTNSEDEFKKGEECIAPVNGLIAELAQDLKGTEYEALVTRSKADFEEYSQIGVEVHGVQAAIWKTRRETLDPAGLRMAEACGNLGKAMSDFSKKSSDEAKGAMSSAKFMAGVNTGVAILVGIVSALLISRSVLKPLREMINRLHDIAQGEGDLTQRVDEDRQDEMGEMGRWFNAFVVRIQDVIKQVSGTTHQVASAATEIAASAEEMAAGLKNQEDQSVQMTTALQQTTQSVMEVARKSAETAAAAKDSGRDATEGGNVVSETVVQMKGISEQVQQSAKSIDSLGKKSEQIGQIIGVINDIAEQTNLLALNAAIEAARAGEHGRGFAVVADEVRKLAERTTKATEEVASSIREVQAQTSGAVENIRQGAANVSKGVELANDAGGKLERIVSGSRNVESMVQSIAAAAEEQSAAIEQISRSVQQINAVTRESNQAAGQSAEAAVQLSRQAEDLKRLVDQFKV